MAKPELTIVVPTYNEGDIIVDSLEKVGVALADVKMRTEIIIADDGRDDMIEVIERYKASSGFNVIRVLRNKERLGKGESIRRAFAVSQGEIVGFIDADLSVSPVFIVNAVQEIKKGSDICIASRVGNRLKTDKSLGITIAAWIFSFVHRKLLFGKKRSFSDTQCGFKFFKREVANRLYDGLIAKANLNDLEVLLKAVKIGYKVSEIEVPRRNDRVGKTSLSTILTREAVSLCQIIIKYRLGFVSS